ncbi:MAG: glycosyltransferase family 39 protein [Anaerolineales bacterium]|nr:glycosyltransferase family 39 protein [Anaerolineales bacterium]
MALLVLAGLTRFWALGEAPPGLYRDEAYNGLDALAVLDGEHHLFFPANNGREPLYIYLTAIAVSLLGRTALAVRLAAAVAGTLTTLVVFGLARSWFDTRTGLLAAFLWAITLWPIHLSRIGLRPILLAPCLGLTFWLATEAWRRRSRGLWLAAGLVYGLSFYTYLAARFTPLLLIVLLAYLIWQNGWRRLWPDLLWFGAGAFFMSLPLAIVLANQPEALSRAGQVSILSETINGGDLWGTLWRHIGRGLGLFIWRGDTILRHNPAGRPLFDLFMALPWLGGIFYLLRRWRQPVPFTILLWHLVMLGPTILAEDAPHFLRASGLLPVAMLPAAVGLSQIWSWNKLPVWKNQSTGKNLASLGAVLVLILGLVSLLTTIRDYQRYNHAPETAYLFEAAARDMAAAINADSRQDVVLVEERYRQGWASIPFLVTAPNVRYISAEAMPALPAGPAALYLWPYQPLDFVRAAWPEQVEVETVLGPETRGDLETEPYPLYLNYRLNRPEPAAPVAIFAGRLVLLNSQISQLSAQEIEISLWWSASQPLNSIEALPQWNVFVHVGAAGQPLIGQSDRLPARGYVPWQWWQPGLVVIDRHRIQLTEPFQPEIDEVRIGFFDPASLERVAVTTVAGEPAGDTWLLQSR